MEKVKSDVDRVRTRTLTLPMIPEREDRISFGQLAAAVKPRVTYETVRRWALFGRTSAVTDSLVYLEFTQVGGRFYTSRKAYDRFLLRINGQEIPEGEDE